MNKILLILTLVGTSMLTACSTYDVEPRLLLQRHGPYSSGVATQEIFYIPRRPW